MLDERIAWLFNQPTMLCSTYSFEALCGGNISLLTPPTATKVVVFWIGSLHRTGPSAGSVIVVSVNTGAYPWLALPYFVFDRCTVLWSADWWDHLRHDWSFNISLLAGLTAKITYSVYHISKRWPSRVGLSGQSSMVETISLNTVVILPVSISGCPARCLWIFCITAMYQLLEFCLAVQ